MTSVSPSTVVTYPDGAFALVNRKGRPLWLISHRFRAPDQGLVVFEAAGDHDIVCLLCHRSTGVDADSRVETQAQPARACFEVAFKSHQRTRTLLREHGVVRQEHIYERLPFHRRGYGRAQRPSLETASGTGDDVLVDSLRSSTEERDQPTEMLVDEQHNKQRYWVAVSPAYVAAGLGWPGESLQLYYERPQQRAAMSFTHQSGVSASIRPPEDTRVRWVGFSCWDASIIIYRVDVLHLPESILFPMVWFKASAPHGHSFKNLEDAHFSRMTENDPSQPSKGIAPAVEPTLVASTDLVLLWCDPDDAQLSSTTAVDSQHGSFPTSSRERATEQGLSGGQSNLQEHPTNAVARYVPVWASSARLAGASPVFRALFETSGMRETRRHAQRDMSLARGVEAGAPGTTTDAVGIHLPGVSEFCLRTALTFLDSATSAETLALSVRWSPEESLALLYFADTYQWDSLANTAAQVIRRHLQGGSGATLSWKITVANAAVRLIRTDLLVPAFETIALDLDKNWPVHEQDEKGYGERDPKSAATLTRTEPLPLCRRCTSVYIEPEQEQRQEAERSAYLWSLGLETMDLYVLLGVISFWNRPSACMELVRRWLRTRTSQTVREGPWTGTNDARVQGLDPQLELLLQQCLATYAPTDIHPAHDADSETDGTCEHHDASEHRAELWRLVDEDHLFDRPRLCLPPPLDALVDESSHLAVALALLHPSPWSRDAPYWSRRYLHWERTFVRYIPGYESLGVLAFLGNQPLLGRVWRNPQRTGLVHITASSLLNLNREHLCDHLGRAANSFVTPRPQRGLPNDVYATETTRSGSNTPGRRAQTSTSLDESAETDEHAWVAIDLGAPRRVRLTHYALRHDERDGEYLREWILEGKADDHDDCRLRTGERLSDMAAGQVTTLSTARRQTWLCLQHQRHDERLAYPNALAVWALSPDKDCEAWLPPLRHIRLRALRNSAGTNRLVLASWEFYGQVLWCAADASHDSVDK